MSQSVSEQRKKAKYERDRKAVLALKQEVFGHYGGKCACCPEDNLEFLQLDHMKGTGVRAKDRYKIPRTSGGAWLWGWIKKNGFPDGFQVLCANCNFVKRYGNVCPHKAFDLRRGLRFIA